MSRTITPEQKAKSDARREKFRQLAKQVADMSDEQRATLAASMGLLVNVEGRPLSYHNTCLVATQCPTATIVGGFAQWLKAGRCVRKGETGLMIWVPISRKVNADAAASLGVNPDTQAKKTGFMMGTVFDVSQTDEIAAAVAA